MFSVCFLQIPCSQAYLPHFDSESRKRLKCFLGRNRRKYMPLKELSCREGLRSQMTMIFFIDYFSNERFYKERKIFSV